MRITAAIRSWQHIHYYHSVLKELADRGHTLHFVFDEYWSYSDPKTALDEFLKEVPSASWGYMKRRHKLSAWWADVFRELRSYRHYLVMKGQSDYYRRRWRRYLPLWLNILVRLPGANMLLRIKQVETILQWFEDKLPPVSEIIEHLKLLRPDVLIVAPLNLRFSGELEYLKAAVHLQIASITPVFSWDNLTTKGIFHIQPDRLLTWNDTQRKEAIESQGIHSERIAVTGALLFDKWFKSLHVTPREIFCKQHGLDASKPIVMYLGSSRNIAHNETWLITKLRETFNVHRLTDVQFIVRPHLGNYKIYENLSLSHTYVVPLQGCLPATNSALQLFYDSLMHSACILSINTSAMIDAICVDRPVISVMTDVYKETQEDAAHFIALSESRAIESVSSPEKCVEAVKKILAGHDSTEDERKIFLTTWIRPCGVTRLSGEWAADEIENLCTRNTSNN